MEYGARYATPPKNGKRATWGSGTLLNPRRPAIVAISSSTNKLINPFAINAGQAHVEILCPDKADLVLKQKQLGLKASQLGLVRRDASRLPCGKLSFGS